MIVSKQKYLMAAAVVTVLVIACLILVPTPYKWMGALVGYLGLLVISLNYQKTNKACMSRIKELDANKKFKELVNYIHEIKPLGYKGFVVDSYLLFAYYELGDFKAYEITVSEMMKTKQWTRPKFNDFREKVKDNLACIQLLKHFADCNEVQYKGSNLMLMQAVKHYQDGNKEAIIALMNDYPKIPKLKKACMYVLSGKMDLLEGYYESEVVNDIFKKVKENLNG